MKTLEWDDPIVLPETDFRPCLSKAQDKRWLARFPFKGQGLRTKKISLPAVVPLEICLISKKVVIAVSSQPLTSPGVSLNLFS